MVCESCIMEKYEKVGYHFMSYQNQMEKAKSKEECEEIKQAYITNALHTINNYVNKNCPKCILSLHSGRHG